MNQFSIGIIGAGQAATELLQQLVEAEFINIVAIADLKTSTPGIELAKQHRIPTTTKLTDLLEMGESLDILIDVTGNISVREQLRQHMKENENHHTVIMHERIAALLVSLAKGTLVHMHTSDEFY